MVGCACVGDDIGGMCGVDDVETYGGEEEWDAGYLSWSGRAVIFLLPLCFVVSKLFIIVVSHPLSMYHKLSMSVSLDLTTPTSTSHSRVKVGQKRVLLRYIQKGTIIRANRDEIGVGVVVDSVPRFNVTSSQKEATPKKRERDVGGLVKLRLLLWTPQLLSNVRTYKINHLVSTCPH